MPLVKDFVGQPIEGLFTYLALSDTKLFQFLETWNVTIRRWHSIPDELELIEFDELRSDEGSAEFFTGYLLTSAAVAELTAVKSLFEEHYRDLRQNLTALQKD